jgi:hypothetical protein
MSYGFRMPGSANNISVLDASPVFTNMMSGVAPKCEYTINGHQYYQGYFLADGIYPDYSTLVKTILQPQGLERKVQNVIFIALIEFDADCNLQHFAKMQEADCKHVERTFGVLQARFVIVAQPALTWSIEKLHLVMKTCVILHNMIVEDEQNTHNDHVHNGNLAGAGINFLLDVTRRRVDNPTFENKIVTMRDLTLHYALCNNLIAHLWARKGQDADWGIEDENESSFFPLNNQSYVVYQFPFFLQTSQ